MEFKDGYTWKGKTGIYMIENKVNHKKYIGSASKCIYHRWAQHKSNLIKNKHCNRYLQNAWNKYGDVNFEYTVLEEYEPEYCSGMEHWWLQMACPEYNLNTNTTTRLGAKLSVEVKLKMKNKKVSKETREKIRVQRNKQVFSKEVLDRRADSIRKVFNTRICCSNGETYESVTLASERLGITDSSISRILTGATKAENSRHKLNFWYAGSGSNAACLRNKNHTGRINK